MKIASKYLDISLIRLIDMALLKTDRVAAVTCRGKIGGVGTPDPGETFRLEGDACDCNKLRRLWRLLPTATVSAIHEARL